MKSSSLPLTSRILYNLVTVISPFSCDNLCLCP
jgi:hypothetical protein